MEESTEDNEKKESEYENVESSYSLKGLNQNWKFGFYPLKGLNQNWKFGSRQTDESENSHKSIGTNEQDQNKSSSDENFMNIDLNSKNFKESKQTLIPGSDKSDLIQKMKEEDVDEELGKQIKEFENKNITINDTVCAKCFNFLGKYPWESLLVLVILLTIASFALLLAYLIPFSKLYKDYDRYKWIKEHGIYWFYNEDKIIFSFVFLSLGYILWSVLDPLITIFSPIILIEGWKWKWKMCDEEYEKDKEEQENNFPKNKLAVWVSILLYQIVKNIVLTILFFHSMKGFNQLLGTVGTSYDSSDQYSKANEFIAQYIFELYWVASFLLTSVVLPISIVIAIFRFLYVFIKFLARQTKKRTIFMLSIYSLTITLSLLIYAEYIFMDYTGLLKVYPAGRFIPTLIAYIFVLLLDMLSQYIDIFKKNWSPFHNFEKYKSLNKNSENNDEVPKINSKFISFSFYLVSIKNILIFGLAMIYKYTNMTMENKLVGLFIFLIVWIIPMFTSTSIITYIVYVIFLCLRWVYVEIIKKPFYAIRNLCCGIYDVIED